MAAKAAAKEALDQAFTLFKFALSTLETAITKQPTQPTNQRTFTLKVTKLDEALSTLNLAHTSWVSKSDLSSEDLEAHMYSLQWLSTQWTSYNTVMDNYYALNIDAPVGPTKQQEMSICEKKLESLQLNIESSVKQLTINTSKELNPACIPQYTNIVAEIKDELLKYEDLSQKVLNLNPANLDETLEKHETFQRNQRKLLTTIKLKLADTVSTPVTPSNTLRGVKMEESKAPIFSGRTLDYPEFKRSWKAVAGKYWEDENQVEQMKLKVDMTTKLIISQSKTMVDVSWKIP